MVMDGKCGYGVEKASGGGSVCTRTGAATCPTVAFDCGMPDGWDWPAGGADVAGWGLACADLEATWARRPRLINGRFADPIS
jgi:hypothetical protein